jgi:hypothetical protein
MIVKNWNLMLQNLINSAKIAQDKIDSNEDIAQLRANVNLEKQNNDDNRNRT